MVAGSGLARSRLLRCLVLVATAEGLFSGATAWAVPTIDFVILPPTTGAVVYAGGASPLQGIQIPVDLVFGTDTPAHRGSFACVGCLLNFETGGFLAATPNAWLFQGAFGSSFLTITGGVDTDGNGTADIGPSVLLFGSFVGPQISVDSVPGSALAVGVSGGFFLDIKNQELAAFFGLPGSAYVGSMVLGWRGIGEPGSPIFAVPETGLIRNAIAAEQVPEPSGVLLIGMGVVLLTLERTFRR